MKEVILQIVRQNPGVTRFQVMRLTKFCPSKINKVFQELIEENIIETDNSETNLTFR